MSLQTFANLTPAHAVDMVEHALGIPVESFVRPCTSHINRVYEMNTRDGLAFIAKFYRPGRWTEAAIRDEHDFMLDCQDAEIPVVAPAAMAAGDTLAQQDGISSAAIIPAAPIAAIVIDNFKNPALLAVVRLHVVLMWYAPVSLRAWSIAHAVQNSQ